MKTKLFRATAALTLFASVPLLYNACSAFKTSVAAPSAASSGSCGALRAVRANGVVALRAATPVFKSVFADGKVKLAGVGQKASGARTATPRYPAGTELAVVVDAACLRANADALDDQPISRAAVPRLIPNLDDQAVTWTLPAAMTADEISTAAEAEPCVKGLSPNDQFKTSALSFNDPMRAQQSYLAADQDDAAVAAMFSNMSTSGTPVIVAVLDSGVDYTHPDLAPNMAPAIGTDITGLQSTPMDVSSEGHGTHIAGMIAAASNNGVGISGVLPYRAQILAVKITTNASGSSNTTYMYNAVSYALAQGASVINLSFDAVSNGVGGNATAQQALQSAVNSGVPVATVIGNAPSGVGALIDNVNWTTMPGIYATIAGVIGVGAINAADGQKSGFSMYSTTYAEIGAVGAESGTTGVLSTVPQALGGYGRLAGTSMAAPQVTAAAAMAIAMIQNAYGGRPSAADVESLILDSADKRPELAPYFTNGNRLNLLNLVNLVHQRFPLTATGASSGC